MWKTTQIIFYLLLASMVNAQGIHFTNNRFAPIQFNPSSIGGYEGSMRIGGIYRSQFSDFIVHPYQTVALYADAPLNIKFRKKDWSGLAMQAYSDKAGDLSLTHTGISVGGSYHISFDEKNTNVLSIGSMFNVIHRTLNANSAIFPDFLPGTSQSSNDFNRLNALDVISGDVNIGITFSRKIKKTGTLQTGISVINTLQHQYTAIAENQASRRWNAHVLYNTPLINKRTSFEWSVWYSTMSEFNNLSTQFLIHQRLSKKKTDDFILDVGLGYRFGDALQILTGARYNLWNIAISYDLTLSDAKAYNQYNGAIELALYKIIIFNRKPEVKPIIFCPKL